MVLYICFLLFKTVDTSVRKVDDDHKDKKEIGRTGAQDGGNTNINRFEPEHSSRRKW